MIIPGQCLRTPSWTRTNSSGLDEGVSSELRTWICTSDAPTSYASCVDSICSLGLTGTAGLSFLRGTEPVIATAIMAGRVKRISDERALLVKGPSSRPLRHRVANHLSWTDFRTVNDSVFVRGDAFRSPGSSNTALAYGLGRSFVGLSVGSRFQSDDQFALVAEVTPEVDPKVMGLPRYF